MKKHILYVLAIAVMVFPLAACNPQTTAASREKQIAKMLENNQKTANSLVNAILNVHRSGIPNKLANLVSSDFVPNKLDFVRRADMAAYNNKVLDVNPSTTTIVGEDTEMIVKFKWDRTYIPNNSDIQKNDSGETIFVFKKNYRQRWMLQKVVGSDIFNYE